MSEPGYDVLVTGSRLGKYEILAKLGEGGMGEVWRARDEQLHRNVALKVLPPEFARDPSRRARFEQEARALAALNHPNIVAVYEFGEENGRVYLVSELVEGESLRSLLDRGRVTTRRATEIASQIADAMAGAHSAGIIHRDLKPENIMLTASAGAVKVLDFGLAKQTLAGNSDATLTMGAATQPGTVMGTVGYMSPEQVRGANTDHRSDIFSFGVILYELLTGSRAFQAASQVETMNAILHADPPDPADADAVPPALLTIARRCLEKNPEQRFQSAADLAFALRSISGTATFSGAQAPLRTQSAPRPRQRWIWATTAVIGAATLFAAGFYFRDRTLHREPPQFQRLTFRRGLVRNARFSPDGHSVVYTAWWDGAKSHTFLAIPGDPESRDLNLPEESKVLAVSSNSEVAFLEPPFSPDDNSGTLARGSLSGGQMRPQLDGVTDADWSPDGSSLAVERIVDGKARLEYPIGKVIYTSAGKSPYFAIRISPDNRRIAYATYASSGSRVGIGVIDLPDGKPRILGVVSGQTVRIDAAALSWSPDSSEIWFRSFDPDEGGSLYAIDLKGHKRLVHRFPGYANIFDISRDGRVLLRTESTELGILAKGPSDKAERDLSILESGILAGISDDGSMIAASVTGEAGGQKGSIYTRKLDGSAPVRVGDGHAFVLSPDGRWISGYTVVDGTNRQFRLVPTGSGEERAMNIPGLTLAVPLGWVGDEQYIVVGWEKGKDYLKSWRCFFWDARSNVLRPVCPEGIPDQDMFVSPDHKWLLSQIPGGGRFALYPIDGGEPKPVPGLDPKKEYTTGWRSDSQSIYVMANTAPQPEFIVDSLNVFTGKREPFMEVHPSRPVAEVEYLRLTPDGRAYAYNYNVRLSDLYVASGLK
ncbi:MAG: protein kinase [Acidobacteriia bacterium]|nr:protein kinase [Terriglobia bacterium]